MVANRNKDEVLERQYLPIRAKILEIAAALDRIGRAEGLLEADRRFDQLHQALDVLQQYDIDRAERVQQIFSREYDDRWQQEFDMGR